MHSCGLRWWSVREAVVVAGQWQWQVLLMHVHAGYVVVSVRGSSGGRGRAGVVDVCACRLCGGWHEMEVVEVVVTGGAEGGGPH